QLREREGSGSQYRKLRLIRIQAFDRINGVYMKSTIISERLERRMMLSGGNAAFSGTGTAAIAADVPFQIRDVAVQSDGKVLVGGVGFLAPMGLTVEVYRLN